MASACDGSRYISMAVGLPNEIVGPWKGGLERNRGGRQLSGSDLGLIPEIPEFRNCTFCFFKRFERSEAIERLERLERISFA
jgi:hypothetical protein